MSREQRTRLNNMIAERAPGAQIAQPGKATRTPDDDDDDELTDQAAEQTNAPAVKDRRRSVFDPPVQSDEQRSTDVVPVDASTDVVPADTVTADAGNPPTDE